MTRNAEAALLAAAAIVASMGVALVNFAGGTGFDAQVALTFLVFAVGFGAVHMALRRWAPEGNPYLFPIAAFLTAIGFTEIYRLDPGLASIQRWSLLLASAVTAAVLLLLRDEGVTMLRRYRYLFLATAVVLLLLPLLPETWTLHGAEINGSRLWVRLELPAGSRSLSFQPGEIAKVLLVIFLASYLADRHLAMATTTRKIGPIRLPEPRQLGPILIAAGASFAVLVYQRDLGASLLLFALFITMVYVATGRAAYLVTGLVLIGSGGYLAYQNFDHVQRRVFAWLHPFDDFADSGYQIIQSLFAMGSGALTGSGLGLGRPDLIPAASTDFIFASVAEEMGFAGSIAVLAAYGLLFAAGFGIAIRSRDVFRKFLAFGLTIVIAVQAILILAGVLRLFPVTGITLPFMSYGGSSLMANMVLVALLVRTSHGERT
ncbi:MAG: FtsW/RodA/SpoVE family cell cycle protein [Actinomycetota bacterium]|nr:FtsW/RodA/SpoVE family cell cycle protein [Actinomycetota bacterium]